MPLYQTNAGDRILSADINQFYQLLKGVAASGENITLIYNAGSLTFQPSSDPSAGTRVLTIKNNAGTTLFAARYDGLLEMLAAAAAPGSPVAGSLYWDTLIAALRVYDGTTWQELSPTPMRWGWTWSPPAALESTLTGTASFTNPITSSQTQAQLATGATSGSTGGLRLTLDMGNSLTGVTGGVARVRSWQFLADFVSLDANTSYRIYLTDESVTTVPSDTAKHLGIRVAAAVVNFSTSDGAVEQTTDVSSFFSANSAYRLGVTFDGTTARLYVNGTLRATHITRVPSTTANIGPVLRIWNTNSAAANKILALGTMSAILDVAA